MAYETGTITGTFLKPDGTPHTGSVRFTPNAPVIRDQEGDVILTGNVTAPLVAGVVSMELPPSDDATLDPAGATFTVDVRLNGAPTFRRVGVFIAGGETVDLADIGTLDPAAPSYQEWVNDAETAAGEAEASASAAALAVTEAQTARTGAETAQTSAETAATTATTQATAASGSATSALAAEVAAEAAQVAAEAAETGAEAAVAVAVPIAVAAEVRPQLSAWPTYVYGNSYGVLAAGWFTAGSHYTQQMATRLGGGAVTSYALGGMRSIHTAVSMLSGVPNANTGATVANSLWPGTSTRNGLVVLETLGNDIGHYPSMNVAPAVPAVITSANTRYLDSMENLYRAMLAIASSESRHEQGTGTFGGTWTNQSLTSTASSGGTVAYTTTAAAYWEKSITPPQSGPLAGKVFAVVNTLDASVAAMATINVQVDGGTAAPTTPPPWEQYTGVGGTQVNGGLMAIPITLPIDGAAHTVRLTHAGAGGSFMYMDCILIPSIDPNPIAVMGYENPPVVATGVFNQAGVNAWRYNTPLVTARARTAVAAFPNAFYVPSTMTSGGLYSLDGLHANDRGQAQRANDAEQAVQAIRARLASRVLALESNGSFPII